MKTLKNTLNFVSPALFQKSNIQGLGIGYKLTGGKETGKLAIICMVDNKLPESELTASDIVPKEVDGFETDVQETGRFVVEQNPLLRHRPVPGGVSAGHVSITAGTNGCAVVREGKTYFLSNNHVYANSNRCKIGDAILQPGVHDGGHSMSNKVAELFDYIPIVFEEDEINGGCFLGSLLKKFKGKKKKFEEKINFVDAAIAKPVSDDIVRNDIFYIGDVAGIGTNIIGMQVCKSGRTTKYTEGTVQQIFATVRVGFGGGKTALFKDQIVTTNMSEGGDSGSLVLDMDKKAVGLLFAGSDKVTIYNDIYNVLNLLNISSIQ